MPEIGIRQLKNEASEILRAVREEKVEYIITLRGQPVAVLRPLETIAADADAILDMAADVFAGLDAADLADVETAMQRRSDFFGEIVTAAP